MASNKVMICPICGSIDLIEIPEQDEWWCIDCANAIVPLATPQEVKSEHICTP